ncbi:hypothetical protein A2U01_0080748, partial [Trifolium medium]|nr:hypothetical protein [Trifolium medium]
SRVHVDSFAGTHFVVVVVDVEASPMVVVFEALSRPVAGLVKGFLPSPIGFVSSISFGSSNG